MLRISGIVNLTVSGISMSNISLTFLNFLCFVNLCHLLKYKIVSKRNFGHDEERFSHHFH